MSFLQKYSDIAEKMGGFGGLVTRERHDNALKLLQLIKDNNIEGDIVETGVFRGSMSILLCKVIEGEFPDKTLYSCDSFCGCQDPTTGDYPYPEEKHLGGQYPCSLVTVKENFTLHECDLSRVKFIEGYFKNTMPKLREEIDKISLLVFDGDAYSATLEVLNNLYDKVVPGGYVIIDDYCLDECKAATDLFIKDKSIVLRHTTTHLPLNGDETPCGTWFQKH